MNGSAAVFVINLDRSPERLHFMKSHLSALGVDFERVEAIDRAHLSDSDKQKYGLNRYSLDGGMKISDADIAICLSHFKALSRFLEGSAEFALILEDDGFLTPEALDVIRDVAAKANDLAPFDGVELSGWGRSAKDILPVFSCGPITIGKAKKTTPGAAVMLYSRSGAVKLLKHSVPTRTHWDNYLSLSWLHGARFLTARPYPAGHHPAFETTSTECISTRVKDKPRKIRRRLYRLYQGPRKFISDLRWLGLAGVLKRPGALVRIPASEALSAPKIDQDALFSATANSEA